MFPFVFRAPLLLLRFAEELGCVSELHPDAISRASWLFGSIGWHSFDQMDEVLETRSQVLKGKGSAWSTSEALVKSPEVVAHAWSFRRRLSRA